MGFGSGPFGHNGGWGHAGPSITIIKTIFIKAYKAVLDPEKPSAPKAYKAILE